MALEFEEHLANHPVDGASVEEHKKLMLADVRAYRLHELREGACFTQVQLAQRIGLGQRQVSKIEHGDLDRAKIGTLRGYLEAVGIGMSIEYVMGDRRVQIS